MLELACVKAFRDSREQYHIAINKCALKPTRRDFNMCISIKKAYVRSCSSIIFPFGKKLT